MAVDREQIQVEQDQLLTALLDARFFNPWKQLTKFKDERSLRNDAKLELYITSTCNQSCEYCYLCKYPDLYPAEYNKPELIKKNLKILLDYLIVNKCQIPILDLFSGEIWHNQYGWDILEIIYQSVLDGLMIGSIILTSNCSFIDNPKAFQIIQQYVNKFADLGCPLVISISVDGKIIDEAERPRNDPNKHYTDDFYERLGAFAKVNNFKFHPMIAANSVKYWKENFLWWDTYLKRYGRDINDIMTLEVRNNNWTDENINDYCEFLRFLMDFYLKEKFKNNTLNFANRIASVRLKQDEYGISGYTPWIINIIDSFTGCSVANHLTIRLGDLAICPCHRTAYEQYLYGKFKVANDKIVGIHAINPDIGIQILMGNVLTSAPLCDQCVVGDICLRGCYGSQLETMKDPFFPIANVCKFMHAKYGTILEYYKKKGVLDILRSYSKDEPGSERIVTILQAYDKWEAYKNELGEI